MKNEVVLKQIRERCLRILAQHGKTSALNALFDSLTEQKEYESLKKGRQMVRAGLLETNQEVRNFINSI